MINIFLHSTTMLSFHVTMPLLFFYCQIPGAAILCLNVAEAFWHPVSCFLCDKSTIFTESLSKLVISHFKCLNILFKLKPAK